MLQQQRQPLEIVEDFACEHVYLFSICFCFFRFCSFFHVFSFFSCFKRNVKKTISFFQIFPFLGLGGHGGEGERLGDGRFEGDPA